MTIFRNLPLALKKYDCNGLDKHADFMDLLYRMLEFNPMKRISPSEILEHPFIAQYRLE
jgi:serine/threonine protein kinase